MTAMRRVARLLAAVLGAAAARPLRWRLRPDAVPDGTSDAACDAAGHCLLSLRRRGRLLRSVGGAPTVLRLSGARAPARAHAPSACGAAYAFRADGARSEAQLGRLRFAVPARGAAACAASALWVGARRCPGEGGRPAQLFAALTIAVTEPGGALHGVRHADRLWLEIVLDGAAPATPPLAARLDGAPGAFALTCLPSAAAWAAAHAGHPLMGDMGSFIGPSEVHARGYALPLRVAAARGDARGVPSVSLGWVLGALLGGRRVELLLLRCPAAGCGAARRLFAAAPLGGVGTVCLSGAPAGAEGLGEPREGPWAEEEQCFAPGAGAAGPMGRWAEASLLADRETSWGRHLRASLAVAALGERGELRIPPGAKVWVEVGCNNWELLRDQLAGRRDVFLLTFEPLVDKWAFLTALAAGDPRHVALPFAVAPERMGAFAALRSQNYTDFRGEPGRRFRESGASSLLPYSPGFQDHGWAGAPLQYGHFREYLVPSVSLEWVVTRLLGGREIDFLKIDAQGLDYEVFASLRGLARHAARVQMELHAHVRHSGEVACADVVGRMARLHGFRVVRGACLPYDASHHDEVDVTFERA